MKYKKTTYPPINIGTSLMLVVFMVLCMVVFAVLSLSSALKDADYSQKNALRTSRYYEANNQAEELLAQIDAILAGTTSPDARIQKLQALEGVAVSEEASALLITYSVPIDEDEVLQVTLTTVSQPEERYRIQAWTQCSVTEWTGNQSLPVLGSDSY